MKQNKCVIPHKNIIQKKKKTPLPRAPSDGLANKAQYKTKGDLYMKRKGSIISSGVIIALLIIFMPIIQSTIHDDSNNTPKNIQTTNTFNEKTYPDFYKVIGKAKIEKNIDPGKIIYSGFDNKNRTLSVYANLTNSNFKYGQRPRKNINDINPSGWSENKEVIINFIDGTTYRGWFYNRSHLLAHSLGGDDEDYNLITGTRPQNVGKNNRKGGMQYTETLAYNYLANNKNGVIYYSATPNYTKDELVPRTVTVNIKSDDDSIDQCVIIYNVAPGYAIDYATGNFTKK